MPQPRAPRHIPRPAAPRGRISPGSGPALRQLENLLVPPHLRGGRGPSRRPRLLSPPPSRSFRPAQAAAAAHALRGRSARGKSGAALPGTGPCGRRPPPHPTPRTFPSGRPRPRSTARGCGRRGLRPGAAGTPRGCAPGAASSPGPARGCGRGRGAEGHFRGGAQPRPPENGCRRSGACERRIRGAGAGERRRAAAAYL